jgi:hypothetical protein
MTDPERLLMSSRTDGVDELEFQLLDSLRDVSAPPGAKARAWEAVSHLVGVAAASTAVATGAARASESVAPAAGSVVPPALTPVAPVAPVTAGALRALGTKLLAGVAISGTIAGIGGAWMTRHPSPAHSSSVAPPPAAPTKTPSGEDALAVVPGRQAMAATPEPAGVATPEPASIASPSARTTREARRVQTEDGLRIESAMLTVAQSQLRGKNPVDALATLRALAQKIPNGVLGQEREVLTIQALAASGNVGEARRRARAFVSAHPNSPHAPLLHKLTGNP